MNKRRQKKLERDARKNARELRGASGAEFNEFVDFLSHKEVDLGKEISGTATEIKMLQSVSRTKRVSEIDKMASSTVASIATAGAVAMLSAFSGLDDSTTLVTSGIGAIVGYGLGNAVAQFYNKQVVSNTVNDLMINIKKNKLNKLERQREEYEYYVSVLEKELGNN